MRRFVLLILLLWPASVSAQLPHNIPDLCANSPAADKVSAGQTTTLSGTVTKGCLEVRGNLVLANDVDLTVTTLLQYPGSSVTWGTAQAPSRGRLRFAAVPPNTSVDPEQWGTGWVSAGNVSIHGQPLTTWLRLAAEPLAGQTTLTLESAPAGWGTADVLVLPGTNQRFPDSAEYQPQWEKVTVQSVSGATINLTAPLQFDHRGARDLDGVLRYRPHVGKLSRSIVIESANPSVARGHFLVTGAGNVDVRYVRLANLGRTTIANLDCTTFSTGDPAPNAARCIAGTGPVTHIGQNQKGRYGGLHLHMLTTAPQVIGNAVEGSTKWGIPVHRTNNGLIRDNVVHNVAGACINTEDGTETGNHVDHNFAVACWGTGDQGKTNDRQVNDDWGWGGSAYWLAGTRNRLTRNVGANANEYCITMFPVAPGGEREPWLEFDGNECYSVHNGITIYDYLGKCCSTVFEGPVVPIRNTVLWHTGKQGIYVYTANRVTLENHTHLNKPDALSNPSENPFGVFWGDYTTRNNVLRNVNIQGVRVAIAMPSKAGGVTDIYGSAAGTVHVESGTIRACRGIQASTQFGVTGGGDNLPPREFYVGSAVVFGAAPPGCSSQPSAGIAMMFGYAGLPNPNPTVRDTGFWTQPNGSVLQLFYADQRTQNVAGGLAPASATTMTNVIGLVAPVSGGPPPPPQEVCGDKTDNDGDGQIDEGCPVTPPPVCAPSADGTTGVTITTMTGTDCHVWTYGSTSFAGGQRPVRRNGQPADQPWTAFGNGYGVRFLALNSRVYNLNAFGQWGYWNGSVTAPAWISSPDPTVPPPPPLTAAAPTITLTSCNITRNAPPPDTTGGWSVEYRSGTQAIGPTVAPGSYNVVAVWTKAGQPTVTSPAFEYRCGA